MKMFDVTIATAVLENGKEVIRSTKRKLSFPSSADEITMRQWTDFQLAKNESPDWFRQLERSDEAKRMELMRSWDEETWGEFFYTLANLISCVVDAKTADLLKMFPAIADGKTALATLYLELDGLINGYQPKERQTFEWKGHKYIWPKKLVDNMGHEWWGQELTTAESIEALQIEHVYSAKDNNGEFILADRKYHVDVALLAVLSHRILKDGAIEQVPLEYNARRKFVERRIEEFSSAPMSVCLDMAFFLRTSKTRLAVTRISRMRSTPSSTTSPRRGRSKTRTKSGMSGAGT